MPSVEAVAVVTHGRPEVVVDGIARLQRVADEKGVTLLLDADEAHKHGVESANGRNPDLAIALGGDGTMLRALTRFLGTGVPVLGVNFGRVGFLTAMSGADLEAGVRRVLDGDYRTVELATIEVEVGGRRHVAVNDAVITSATLGRIIELGYAIGGEDLGAQRCDGLVCATPPGSTAYNLSNGGPVLVWGLDAMVLTFVAPHSLHVRPLVVPRGPDLEVTNRSEGVPTTVVVDGHAVAGLLPGQTARLRVGEQRSLLATLPEVTFFRRYGDTFGATFGR
ncbi:MAG TPA: NAD(+)/NADH kinase [Gaiellaceae bacterium]|jgi:NAD+ kinase|nr:NAD(+)/NADH kinase [Gaiellaceae bacterium]